MGRVMTSTERSQKRRRAIYSNRVMHEEHKMNERVRKNIANAKHAEQRAKNPLEMEEYRRKEREKKRKQRASKQKPSIVLSTPIKKQIKNERRRARHTERKKIAQKLDELREELETSVASEGSPSEDRHMVVSTALWKNMSPQTKKK